MFRWELDRLAQEQFDSLPHHARQALAELMDAVVIADPLEYRRRHDEPAGRNLRSLHFGVHGDGLVTFLVHPPGELVLVVRIQWLGG